MSGSSDRPDGRNGPSHRTAESGGDIRKLLTRQYREAFGRDADLSRPTLFSERLLWLRLCGRDPLLPVLAERSQQQEYVRAKGFGRTLPRVYAAFTSPGQMRFDALPETFRLRATHLADTSRALTGRKPSDVASLCASAREWLGRRQWKDTGEWEYEGVRPGLQAEEEVCGADRLRVVCVSGAPVALYRPEEPSALFDGSGALWEGSVQPDASAPDRLAEINALCRALAEGFAVVRLEIAETPRGLCFLGMRFTEEWAVCRAFPPGAQDEIGSMLRLPDANKYTM